MKRLVLFSAVLIIIVFSQACSNKPFAKPTPTPSLTPEPTSTPTPTHTPTPTITPTPTLMYGMGSLKTVNGGFFSYRVPKGFTDNVDMAELILNDREKMNIWFSVSDTPFGVTDEEMLLWRLADLTDELGVFSGLEHSEPETYFVGGEDGLGADFQMDTPFFSIAGRMMIITYQEDQYTFVAYATQFDEELEDGKWLTKEASIFDAILSEIIFHSEGVYEPTPAGSMKCQVSTDKEYGYSVNNPIMVGSTSMFDGERRAEGYLEALRSPNGHIVDYTFVSSTLDGSPPKMLSIYLVTYPGHPLPITLYIDTFFYETPMAPVGFTCGGDFPFLAP